MRAKYIDGYNSIPLSQAGFTLIEILVALALGLVVMGAAYSYFLSNLSISRTLIAQSRLQQELRSSSDLMQRDIRRAGYAPNGSVDKASVSTVYLGKTLGSATNNCIIYRYINEKGAIRYSGFLLNANQLYMKTSGSDLNCSVDSNWSAMTGLGLSTISGFSVAYTAGTRPRISISISSTSPKDSKVAFNISQEVILNNAPALGAAVNGS